MDWSLRMVLLFLPLTYCQEMFKDPGFDTLTEWSCYMTRCDLVTDKVEGKFALKVSNRTHYCQGPSQTVNSIVPNGQYEASVYVKLLNDEPMVLGQHVSLTVEFGLPGGKKDRLYVPAADKPMVTSSDGWIYLQGDFDNQTASTIVQYSRITWNTSVDPNALEIQLKQVKHGFPFGTAVRAQQYLHGDRRYSDFINKHFNYAVLENDLKWPMNARHSGAANYDTAVEAQQTTLKWVGKVPPWVRPLRGNTLRKAVTHRISEALNKTKGLVEHWDVNNENLHTQWFRETLQDRDYNLEMFRIAHQVDPSMKLFFNENTVTARGGDTMAYRDMAMQFKQAGVPVHGIGVQTHFRDLTTPDPYLLKINAAGQRFLDLLEKEWMTNKTTKISHAHRQIEVRGFHGDYELTATYHGSPIQTKTTFTLGKMDTHAKLHIPRLSTTIIGSNMNLFNTMTVEYMPKPFTDVH